ncbi:hypothetical protein VNO78_24281 [Psophocarpus tetragonolobus]|uniref:GTP cyclohydrolase 1 n=1 Tax=Psophocarpus tetragonolobus TaxID=3891 RepID=A0AAN9S649_PSOTE
MFPFYFKCHVAYVPSGQRVLGLNKLSHVMNVFAERLQEPQRLANEVYSALHQGINPEGAPVVLQCSHINISKTKPHILDLKHKDLEEIVVSSDSSKMGEINPIMVIEVSSILKSLGEDTTRKELVETPDRYVKLFMNSQCSEIWDIILNGSLRNGISDSLNTNKDVSFNDKKLHSELNLTFLSQCEHHLLPFYGVAWGVALLVAKPSKNALNKWSHC